MGDVLASKTTFMSRCSGCHLVVFCNRGSHSAAWDPQGSRGSTGTCWMLCFSVSLLVGIIYVLSVFL